MMNATEAPHNAGPRPAAGPRSANAAHGSAAAAPANGKAAEGDAPADPFAALLDEMCLPDAEPDGGVSTQSGMTEAMPEAAQAQAAGKPGAPATQPAAPDAFLAMMMPGALAAAAGAQPTGGKANPLLAAPADGAASPVDTAKAGAHKHADAVPDLFVAAATDAAAKQAPTHDFSAVLAAAGATEKKHASNDAAASSDPSALGGVGASSAPGFTPTLDAAPAAPVHQAAIASHPMDPAFAGDLGAEVQWMVDAGVQQADLHLNPADLGPIRIQLSLDAQTANISFAAAHGATRDGIMQALPALREMLATQGLQLGQAGVSSGGQGGQQSFAQAERQAPRGPSRGTGAIEAAPLARSGSATLRAGRGMLDLYA